MKTRVLLIKTRVLDFDIEFDFKSKISKLEVLFQNWRFSKATNHQALCLAKTRVLNSKLEFSFKYKNLKKIALGQN